MFASGSLSVMTGCCSCWAVVGCMPRFRRLFHSLFLMQLPTNSTCVYHPPTIEYLVRPSSPHVWGRVFGCIIQQNRNTHGPIAHCCLWLAPHTRCASIGLAVNFLCTCDLLGDLLGCRAHELVSYTSAIAVTTRRLEQCLDGLENTRPEVEETGKTAVAHWLEELDNIEDDLQRMRPELTSLHEDV
jgi:hypothetical protein